MADPTARWFLNAAAATLLLGAPARAFGQVTIVQYGGGIARGSGLQDIVAGPDGALWFTETADRIGRITTGGVVSEFSAGITPGSRPTGIAKGPDGALWFTESGGDRIGRAAWATRPPRKHLRRTSR